MENDYYQFLYFLNSSKIKPESSLHDLENTCNLIGIKPDLNIKFEDIYVSVASLDDLILMKKAAGRTRDLADLEELYVVKRLKKK